MNNTGQKNILLVEDEAIIGMALSKQLNEYGYIVNHVLTGPKAIKIVNDNETTVDLILMDINLGEKLDGIEIAKIILKDHDIPLLFHSNHTEREIVNRTEDVTSYGYVVKNGITVLDASIKSAFRLHEANKNMKLQQKEIERKSQQLEMYEKRYRRLFESAKDGILILSADDGMILDVNPYLIEMLGYSKEQFLAKNIWDLSAFKNISYSKKLYKELQDKLYVRYEDLPLQTSEGNLIHVEFVSNVYLVDKEKVIQCNVRDITARRKYEKTLTDDIDNKRALLKEIQHRIKNSFGLIISLLRIRSNSAVSQETKDTLNELILRVRSMSDLYSLLHETDSFFEINLKIYCDQVIEWMHSLSENIVIKKDIEQMMVQPNYAAPIGMMLVELLSNSIKYAFPGSKGIINIELKSANSKIILIVEDDGIGLPKDFKKSQITSLGLQIVCLMVEQLQGQIQFISDKGTKVVIVLPTKSSMNITK